MGYDPDELSEEELQALTKSAEVMGNSHLLEMLAAFHCSDESHDTNVNDNLHALIHCHGIRGRFNLPDLPHETFSKIILQPLELGRYLARNLRKEADFKGKIDNNMLRDMLGVIKKDFNSSKDETKVPFSFATEDTDAYIFSLLKKI